jgi:hypothetical protein
MFVNGCAGTGSVYVTNGSTKVTGASNIPFAGTSGYQYTTAGSPDITFYVSSLGGTDPLKSFTASFTAKTHYSVFVGGIITNSSYVVTADDLSAPSSGNAKVRFINLSNDTLSENVAANTTSIATGITSLQASSFTAITAGTYIIKAGDPANIGSVVSTASLSFSAGKIYTVILTGTLSGTGTSGLTLTVLNNN